MFRIPLRTHNGLLLMTYLASNTEAVSLDEIAKRENISQGYLEEIANVLRQAKLIEGKRGQHGGYILTQDAKTLTVAKVLEVLEGPLRLVDCLGGDNSCAAESNCSNRKIWQLVQDRMSQTLSGIALSDLASPHYTLNRLPA